MTDDPNANVRRVPRGAAVEWTDDDLDRLAEIHVEEDTPLMLAFARQYAPARLAAVLTAQRQDIDGDATNTTTGE